MFLCISWSDWIDLKLLGRNVAILRRCTEHMFRLVCLKIKVIFCLICKILCQFCISWIDWKKFRMFGRKVYKPWLISLWLSICLCGCLFISNFCLAEMFKNWLKVSIYINRCFTIMRWWQTWVIVKDTYRPLGILTLNCLFWNFGSIQHWPQKKSARVADSKVMHD